jgi:hypothetical protein
MRKNGQGANRKRREDNIGMKAINLICLQLNNFQLKRLEKQQQQDLVTQKVEKIAKAKHTSDYFSR